MAKGNFNGLIKGKKGNTVFYRVTNSNNKEKQGLREYVPTVANPKSQGQLYQRAIVATVMRAYAAGKAIFDHSFENIKTGGQSMNHFQKINIGRLRSTILTEIRNNTAVADQLGRVVAPQVNKPVPFTFIVSEGSLEQDLFAYDEGFALPNPTSSETVAAYAERNHLVASDIYTAVMFMVDPGSLIASAADAGDSAYGKQFNCQFGFIRMKVKENLSSVTETFSTYGQIFEIEKSDARIDFDGTNSYEDAISITNVGGSKYTCGSIAIIKSRDNERLRSNSTMVFEGKSNFGIASEYVLNAWQKGVLQIGQSQLILEGGNF